ncbi:hypothetical protein JIG36_11825 [Actinoplanes sp. LDG1-06]|uniref:Uncharacterized protein n=1 Tax=Paractinoplanes ovalisporus TaxID=2810368 RepID=A0ABS2A8S9_9ACTN|nr:hypothetical protein [Actinoplanes ovalisporus]MBM2616246.1 hypothetical protein [Actinoplanes ovalisporus]
MPPDETVGVPAHRGGLLVDDPVLSVGVVQITSRPSGLDVELIARRGVPAPRSPRVLLPPYDEGVDLRVGWLDPSGRAHWEYGSVASDGVMWRTRVYFPAHYDEVCLLLAWPEIGFPEFTALLPLPSRPVVERAAASIWQAPVVMAPVPSHVRHRPADGRLDAPRIETGRLCAAPRVLARERDGVVVLTRVTAVDRILALAVDSLARIGGQARPGPWGAGLAVLNDRDAIRLDPHESEASGDEHSFQASTEYLIERPAAPVLDLIVAWPAIGLTGILATVDLVDPVSL